MKEIKTGEYTIHFGNATQRLGNWLSGHRYSSVFAIVDEEVAKHWKPLLDDWTHQFQIKTYTTPFGEKRKSIRSCEKIWKWLMEQGADRNSLLLNIGGGIVGDMGGFCAATFKRGIDFIQIPTTLLAQVDASLGGKLAVNFNHIKNNIGIFKNPETVLIDPAFLDTLSQRELHSGFAEVIKHALVADSNLWHKLLKINDLKEVDWLNLLPQAIEVKNKIVKKDPYEKADRKALNFGHTVGHALESAFMNSKNHLLHGEAVAIGMICECYLSHKFLDLPKGDLDSIIELINRFFEKRKISKRHIQKACELVKHDKKNQKGRINYSLISSIGAYSIDHYLTEVDLRESLNFYNLM